MALLSRPHPPRRSGASLGTFRHSICLNWKKADLSMHCLILWSGTASGSTSFTNNEYVCAIPFLKLQLEVFHTISLRAWMSKVGHSFMKLFRCVEFLVKTQGNHIDW